MRMREDEVSRDYFNDSSIQLHLLSNNFLSILPVIVKNYWELNFSSSFSRKLAALARKNWFKFHCNHHDKDDDDDYDWDEVLGVRRKLKFSWWSKKDCERQNVVISFYCIRIHKTFLRFRLAEIFSLLAISTLSEIFSTRNSSCVISLRVQWCREFDWESDFKPSLVFLALLVFNVINRQK